MEKNPIPTLPTPDEARKLFEYVTITQKICFDMVVGKLPSKLILAQRCELADSIVLIIKRMIEDEDKTENTD